MRHMHVTIKPRPVRDCVITARASMLAVLMNGRALAAKELAEVARVTGQTARGDQLPSQSATVSYRFSDEASQVLFTNLWRD